MTVETTARKQSFAGGQAALTYTFKVLPSNPTHVKVKAVLTSTGAETDLTYTTEYTVAQESDGVGGVVTVNPTYSTLYTYTVYRVTENKQESDYDDYNTFPADTLEKDIDRRTMIDQEQDEDLDRAVTLPISSSLSNIELPEPGESEYLRWNAAGTALETATVVGEVGDPITITVADGDNNVCITATQNDVTNDPVSIEIVNAGVGPGLKVRGAGSTIYVQEQADAAADIEAYGQIWVNTATPNELYFTDDAGTDWLLNASASTLQEVFDAGQAIVIADEDDQTLALTQNDVTNNPAAMTITNAGTGDALFIDQNGAGVALQIDNASTDMAISIIQDGNGVALDIDNDGSSLAMNILSTSDNAAVLIKKDGAGAGTVLEIENDGTGVGLFINQDGLGVPLTIDSENATADWIIRCMVPSGSDCGFMRQDLVTGNALMAMGGDTIWVDAAGKLRIKSGQPTGDTDGTVVGTQS